MGTPVSKHPVLALNCLRDSQHPAGKSCELMDMLGNTEQQC